MGADLGPSRAETVCEVIRQVLGTAGVHVENAQVLNAFRQQRMGHRRACAAGTHLDHASPNDILQVAPETFREPQAVGVMADAFARFEHHGVDRPNAPGLVGQFIE